MPKELRGRGGAARNAQGALERPRNAVAGAEPQGTPKERPRNPGMPELTTPAGGHRQRVRQQLQVCKLTLNPTHLCLMHVPSVVTVKPILATSSSAFFQPFGGNEHK